MDITYYRGAIFGTFYIEINGCAIGQQDQIIIKEVLKINKRTYFSKLKNGFRLFPNGVLHFTQSSLDEILEWLEGIKILNNLAE